MNSDPDSMEACFCDYICFSQLHQCSCDPSAVTLLLPHPSCCHSPTSPSLLLSSTLSSYLSLPSIWCSSHALKPYKKSLRQELKDISQVGRMEATVMRSMITRICHLWWYMLGFTSRLEELCFFNYSYYETKTDQQLCSGEGKWVRSSQFLRIPLPLTVKQDRIKLATELATSRVSSACRTLNSHKGKQSLRRKLRQAETSQLWQRGHSHCFPWTLP